MGGGGGGIRLICYSALVRRKEGSKTIKWRYIIRLDPYTHKKTFVSSSDNYDEE